jgi:3-oxoacyl-[acyl-carrier protein] reductase
MDLGLKDKRALVLSSSRGLGLGIGTALADEGAAVILVDRNRDRLAAAADKVNARGGGGSATPIVADLTKAADIESLIARVEEKTGGIDILVNNTGGPPAKPAVAMSVADLTTQFEIIVASVIGITNRFLPGMRARKWGRILTIASSGVLQPIPNLALSNTLRLSLLGWSKTLAAEVAADGVTVNVILPGRIQTERLNEIDQHTAAATGKGVEDVVNASKLAIPMGRYGTVEELGAVAAFLAGVPASYVTGSIIRVDGGYIKSV